ncbi:MAG: hypothetical protein H8E56_00010 [Candidatus Marinimicrobia bacterium]|nr:hypothetical protein [Candidatus Neomarinimicrobiota bacterium]
MKITHLFIITLLLVGSLPAQGEFNQESYWIYTYSSELENYQINAIEGDNLVINNGDWDVKIPIEEIELIALPPKPGLLGQVAGGVIGGYGGALGGCLIGVMIFPAAFNDGGSQFVIFMLAGAAAGVYYGSKLGGGFLKGKPEVIADLGFMTLAEKKDWIQTNLIY